MNTKIVYALACDEKGTYISQALISVFSARYYNTNAEIILLVDDCTDLIIQNRNIPFSDYITEKIVIHFEDGSLTPLYKSRWLKTSARRLVRGSILYVDCDTIIQKPITDIDNVEGDIVMVLDAHMKVEQYTKEMFELSIKNCAILNFDATPEKCYYNGGVILAKDTNIANELFNSWHNEWLLGTQKGFFGDEPSLMKVNNNLGHIIKRLADTWNCQVFMSPIFMPDSYILHFWCLKNRSYIFDSAFLEYVKQYGIDSYTKKCILNPLCSMLPFDNYLSRYRFYDFVKMPHKYETLLRLYINYINPTLDGFPWINKLTGVEKGLLRSKMVWLALIIYSIRQWINFKVLKRKHNPADLLCA